MEDYIKTHGSKEESAANLAEYKELKLISKCHSASRRYPTIKKWFLESRELISIHQKRCLENRNRFTVFQNSHGRILVIFMTGKQVIFACPHRLKRH